MFYFIFCQLHQYHFIFIISFEDPKTPDDSGQIIKTKMYVNFKLWY